MKLVGKLNVSQTLNGRQSVGGKGGGAADWEHLKNKPFETLGEDFTVDNGALEIADGVIPSLDGYATEDYVDSAVAAITPTIPAVSATSTLSSGTEIGSITIDGVTTTYYAPQGGSVNIDNKSLIEVDGVIQEAVPIYSEGGSVAITLNSAPGAYMDVYTKTFGGEYGEYIYNNGVVSGANYKVYFRVNYFDAEHIEIIDTFDTYGYINNLNVEQYMQSYIGYGNFTENSPCKQFNFNLFSLQSQSYGDVQTYGKVRLDYDLDSVEARRYELVCLSIEELQDSQFDETNETYRIGSSIIYHKLPNEYLNIDNETIKVNSDGLLCAVAPTPTVDWSDIDNKPNFATVATSGDYNDLSNTPTIPVVPTDVSAFNNDAGYITNSALDGYATEQYVDDAIGDIDLSNYATQTDLQQVEDEIPQADGTTIIDNNGVWSAVGGGSVDIDNKSIIKNQDDEIQEAVPLYSEVDVTDVGDEGLLINNYRFNGSTNGDFYIDTNETQLTFVAAASNTNDYYKIMLAGENGWIVAKWRNTTSITYNCVIEDASSYFTNKIGQQFQCYYRYQQDAALFPNGNHYGVKFHIYMPNVDTNYSQWTNMSFYPTDAGIAAGDTLETQCETLGLDWGQGQWVIIEYHKLPNEYLNLKSNEVVNSGYYPMLYNDANGNIRAKRLGAGNNMSLATMNLADGTQGYQLSCTLQPSPIGGNYYNNGSYGFGNGIIAIDTTHWYAYLGVWSGFFNNSTWGSGDYIYEAGYVGGNYGVSNPFKVTGFLHVGTTIDDVSLEGFETIIDHVSYNSSQDRLQLYFKEGIKPYAPFGAVFKYIGNVYQDIQRVNSFWLPLDKETIVVDANGNIKTAIPAPPTADGTYTLQATVSNGVLTYSWI